MTTRRRPERDKLDDWLDIWAREIPSLDRTTEGVVERIGHLAKDLDRSMEETLLTFGLDRRSFHLSAGSGATARRTAVRPASWPGTCACPAVR